MKNNGKYEFVYIGKTYPECNLEKTCKNENIENVTFKGEFNNKDKPEIYKDIDIINKETLIIESKDELVAHLKHVHEQNIMQ